MSLMATYAAALAVYAHLQHSLLNARSSARIGWRVGLFYLIPLFPVLDWFFAISSTAFDRFKHRNPRPTPANSETALKASESSDSTPQGPPPRVESYSTGFSHPNLWLAEVTGIHVESPRKTSVPLWNASTLQNLKSTRKENSKTIKFGQLAVLMFVSAQCSGSLIRGGRRIAHGDGAAIVADIKMFWISLSALIVVVQSVLVIAHNREYCIEGAADATLHTIPTSSSDSSRPEASQLITGDGEPAQGHTSDQAVEFGGGEADSTQPAVQEQKVWQAQEAADSQHSANETGAFQREFWGLTLLTFLLSVLAYILEQVLHQEWLSGGFFYRVDDFLVLFALGFAVILVIAVLGSCKGVDVDSGSFHLFIGLSVFFGAIVFSYITGFRSVVVPFSSVSGAFVTGDGASVPVNASCPQLWRDDVWAPGF